MLPNPLFSQSNSHSHSQSLSLSQRRRLLLQVPPSCCPDQNVPIWAHKHAVQNVLQPKIQKQKKKQTRCERGSHGILFSFFWLFSAGFLSRFSCFILRLSVCSLSASLRDLNIYIFFVWVRISLDIETFERVLCNYSISWRCKQPNSSAYLALIAAAAAISSWYCRYLYIVYMGTLNCSPPASGCTFKAKWKMQLQSARERKRGTKRVCSADDNNNEITIIILLFFQQ